MIKLDIVQRQFDDQFAVYAYLHRREYDCSIAGRWVLVAVNNVKQVALSYARRSIKTLLHKDDLEFEVNQ